MPEGFTLHLLSVFGYVADADAGNLPHVLRRELKRVGGTTKKKGKKSYEPLAEFTQGFPLNGERLNSLVCQRVSLLCISWD